MLTESVLPFVRVNVPVVVVRVRPLSVVAVSVANPLLPDQVLVPSRNGIRWPLVPVPKPASCMNPLELRFRKSPAVPTSGVKACHFPVALETNVIADWPARLTEVLAPRLLILSPEAGKTATYFDAT